MKKLTPKQEQFCLKYIECGNATQAFKGVYNTETMKPKTIHNRSSELLGRREIRGRIEELKKKAEDKAVITLSEVLDELKKVAFSTKTTSSKVKALELLGKHLGLGEKTRPYKRFLGINPKVLEILEDERTERMTNEEQLMIYTELQVRIGMTCIGAIPTVTTTLNGAGEIIREVITPHKPSLAHVGAFAELSMIMDKLTSSSDIGETNAEVIARYTKWIEESQPNRFKDKTNE